MHMNINNVASAPSATVTSTTTSANTSSVPVGTTATSTSTSTDRGDFSTVFSFVTSSALFSSVTSTSSSNGTSRSTSILPPAAQSHHAHPQTQTQAPTPSMNPFAIIVSPRQRGNPLLQCIRNVPWQYSPPNVNLLPDFLLSEIACALYLSIKYHILHPTYIHQRMQSIGNLYSIRVLFVRVDSEHSEEVLMELTRLALIRDWTMVCVWSDEECARYLETFKVYEKKGSESLESSSGTGTNDKVDRHAKLLELLTMIKSINRTDVATLASQYNSFAEIALRATPDNLSAIPGFGDKKVSRLLRVLNQPFVSSQAITSVRLQQQQEKGSDN